MKRMVSIITLSALLLSLLLTGPVAAAENNRVELKEAIEIAKNAFDFDTANYDFNSSYSETMNGRKLWFLNWSSISGNGSGISVSVDAETGEVVNMSQWESTIAPQRKIPKYTRDEALKIAEALIKKLHPDKLGSIKLVDQDRNYLLRSIYLNDSYYFYFIRQINGIDFQDNGIQVQVDKNTLKVKYFNLDWDKAVPIPDSKKAISKDAAKKIFAEKLGLELAYQMIYPNPAGDPRLILAYIQKNANHPIDAITGEIITQPYYGPVYAGQDGYAMGSVSAVKYELTPQEQKEVADSGKFISKEKAMEALMKYVTVDSKFKLDNSYLYSGMNNENATWSFSWSYNDPEKNIYNYIYGSVDAVTGEVKSFNISSSEDQYKPGTTPKYTKEQCREIAEKFLKEIQPEKFKNSEYREQYYEIYMPERNVVNYSMYYIRKENGIAAPFNNLNVIVNSYTGKVTGFSMVWNNIEFPDAKGVISLDEAYKVLYAKHDLALKYIRIYDYMLNNGNSVIKLAYMLDNYYGMIDAKSGQFIDYNGNPVVDGKKVEFTDIDGHKYEKDIKLLAELGIIDSAESKFNPDEPILQKDFVKLLMKAAQPDYYPIPYATSDGSEYDRYYESAIAQNILARKDKNPDAKVTRMEAAKMMVKALGVGFIADLGSIFKLDVKDSAGITPENKGYAAIAAALGLVDVSGGSFEQGHILTRGETAGMLVKYLLVDKNPQASEPVPVPLPEPVMDLPATSQISE